MGSLRGDNGGGPPSGGGDLPELPPEWGAMVIPDDPAELAREATQIRRELRRFGRRNRWRRRLHRPLIEKLPTGRPAPTLGIPILIMAIAIVATVTSLFALAWPGQGGRLSASPPLKATQAPATIPDLNLVAADGSRMAVRNTVPAVFLVVDGCSCGDLLVGLAGEVPAGVAVVAVARTLPLLPSALPIGWRLLAAADPEGTLRATYAGTPPADGVIAILVKLNGEVIKVATGLTSIVGLQPDLDKLRS